MASLWDEEIHDIITELPSFKEIAANFLQKYRIRVNWMFTMFESGMMMMVFHSFDLSKITERIISTYHLFFLSTNLYISTFFSGSGVVRPDDIDSVLTTLAALRVLNSKLDEMEKQWEKIRDRLRRKNDDVGVDISDDVGRDTVC